MKLIITGALGHIGSHLIRHIGSIFKDAHVVMVDDLSTQRYASLFDLPKNVSYTFLEGKAQDMDLSFVKEAQAVIHLAAMTNAAGTASTPELVHENNFQSTKSIADTCLKFNVPLIFPSSTSVYGSQSSLVDEGCTREELQPQSPYAESKLEEEDYIQSLTKKGLQAVICRLGTIFGTSRGMRFHTAVNKFCWQAVMNQPITVWETALHQKRPYLDLEDCVRALCWIMEKDLYDGDVYNIVTENLTVQDVVDQIQTHKPSLEVELVQHKIMNQLSYEVDRRKFEKTGFVFKGSIKQGIEKTITLLNQAHTETVA